jgi:hypothetical protein
MVGRSRELNFVALILVLAKSIGKRMALEQVGSELSGSMLFF